MLAWEEGDEPAEILFREEEEGGEIVIVFVLITVLEASEVLADVQECIPGGAAAVSKFSDRTAKPGWRADVPELLPEGWTGLAMRREC